MRPTFANSFPAFCRTRVTALAPRKIPTKRLPRFRRGGRQLVFLDIWLQGSKLDGLQLLEIIKGEHPTLPVVMISGHGNIETAVTATKLGAYDFIEKPFKADRLVLVADRAIEASRLKREVSELRARAGATNRIVGKSTAMNQLRQLIERIAPANSRIMITGTPGSGKELVARTDSRGVEPRRRSFLRDQRRDDRARDDGSGTVRHRASERACTQGRRARRGAWRHALYRRDRRYAEGNAGENPPRARRSEFHSCRRIDPRACRCAGDFLDARAICRPRSPKAPFARICSTGFPSSLSACRLSPSGETISLN